ncbi:MAG: prolipoprotein diacylglyceryl transferase family protein [Terracidiphilus sp.]
MYPVLFHIGRMLIPSYGVVTAVGVLVALATSQRTARVVQVDPAKVWNLCILSLFAVLAATRLLLVLVNWSVLRAHPTWVLALAMVHHPLLTGVGALAGIGCAAWYARASRLPFTSTADSLAAPLSLGLAFEQVGTLLEGSGYGVAAGPGTGWAITYTNPLAALWSGAPLGVAVHPVQIYAAMAFLAIGVLLLVWLPLERQRGDVAGLWLMSAGVAIYITEFWREPEGRGPIFGGAIDGPQVAAVLMVISGALALRERVSPAAVSGLASHPFHDEAVRRMGQRASEPGADDGAAHE